MMSLIQRNLPAKLVAFVAAIALWFFVMNEQNPMIDSSFTVPLNVVNAPAGYKVTRSVEEVKIKVRGPRALFAAATAADFKAYVDLQGIDEGRQIVKVQAVLPQGFEFIELSPSTAAFTIDKIIQKQVPVEVRLGGSPAQGMTVDKAVPVLKQVTIEGPSDAVASVVRVSGYVGVGSNMANDFTQSISLVAVNADGREVTDIRIVPQEVDVSVQLSRSLVKKTVSVKAVAGLDLPAGYVLNGIKLDPAKIEIAGDEKTLDGITFIETQLISLADISSSGVLKKDIRLKVPAGITVTNETIHVNIDVAEKK